MTGPQAREASESNGASDGTTTIGELKAKVDAFAAERDWHQFHTPKNLTMALAAAASTDRGRLEDPARAEKIREELADVVIYALEFANIAGIDLSEAVVAKMAQNARKYPVEKARGRSEKYTEL